MNEPNPTPRPDNPYAAPACGPDLKAQPRRSKAAASRSRSRLFKVLGVLLPMLVLLAIAVLAPIVLTLIEIFG